MFKCQKVRVELFFLSSFSKEDRRILLILQKE